VDSRKKCEILIIVSATICYSFQFHHRKDVLLEFKLDIFNVIDLSAVGPGGQNPEIIVLDDVDPDTME